MQDYQISNKQERFHHFCSKEYIYHSLVSRFEKKLLFLWIVETITVYNISIFSICIITAEPVPYALYVAFKLLVSHIMPMGILILTILKPQTRTAKRFSTLFLGEGIKWQSRLLIRVAITLDLYTLPRFFNKVGYSGCTPSNARKMTSPKHT